MAVVSWLEWVGVKCLGSVSKRRGCRLSRCRGPISEAYGEPAKLDFRRAATQIWAPHLCEPAAARQIPTASLCCAALEVSFSLLRLPGPSLNTCACLACATPRYRHPARTYVEYNTREPKTYHSLIPTLRTLKAPAATVICE